MHWANFIETWQIASMDGTIQVCSNEGPSPSPRGDNSQIVKLYWKYFKIFFSRTTGPISTKHGTKHPWMKGIHVYSNEGSRHSPMGDNSKNIKLYWKYFKSFLQNHRVNFIKTWHKASLDEGDSSLFKWKAMPFSRGYNSKIVKLY